jgi:hypothetical protein|tara:strand:- start:21797 stop:23302 length:1506 start_codon:yes stop_codon:yes gene_type:complete
MCDFENPISKNGHRLLDRRSFLKVAGVSMGAVSLLDLLAMDRLLAQDVKTIGGKQPIRPMIDPRNPYASRLAHHEAKAKQLLVIYLPGAISHVDTFDWKPDLEKYDGQKPDGIPKTTFEGPTGNIAKPFWGFSPKGKSGKMVSSLLPNLGNLVDDFCFIHSLYTETSAHPTGENFFNTGFTMEGFPSRGAWISYALGTVNEELPAYVAIADPRGLPRSGRNNWGSGFLPASFQATDFNMKNPPANIDTPSSIGTKKEQRTKDFLKKLNENHLEEYPEDADLASRIASYELAGKMQASIPDVMNIDKEPKRIMEEYGADSDNELKREYARNCILARRLVEKGVRVVELFNGSDAGGGNGIWNWDSHANIVKTHEMQAAIMDQPTAALIADMKRRGLLEDTLVVWCSEFGRMPFLQANGTGRDHNPDAFTAFMTGAGVKKGFSFGSSDNWGWKAAENKRSVYDFNATILHLLGLDHERLTYYHNGLERRLTHVHGEVIHEMLS